MKKREDKEQLVAELTEKLKNARAVIFTNYRGLNVSDATQLRKTLREAGVEFRVVKNTLTRIAATAGELQGIEEFLTGPTAIAFGYEDPVTPAKLLADFIKNKRDLEVKGGLVEGRVVGLDEIKTLAALPTREELLAKLVGGLQAPLAGLSSVLQGPIRKLVYGLKAVQEQKAAANA